MDGRTVLAFGLAAVLLVCGIWLLVDFSKRRRAFKARQQGRKKH